MSENKAFLSNEALRAEYIRLKGETERQGVEIERLKTLVAEFCEDIMCGRGFKDADGWYCTQALSDVRDAGDMLVSLGLWEHREGSGRLQYYKAKGQPDG